jgi:hypothetical protein
MTTDDEHFLRRAIELATVGLRREMHRSDLYSWARTAPCWLKTTTRS